MVSVHRHNPELSCPLLITDNDSPPFNVMEVPPGLQSPFHVALVFDVQVVNFSLDQVFF